MGKETQLIKNTLLYAVGNIGSKVLMFLIVPLFTFYLTTDEMGEYDLVVSVVSLGAPVLIWSIYEGVYRWSVEDPEGSRKYIRYGLVVEFRNLAIFSICFLALMFFIPIRYGYVILLSLIFTCLDAYVQRVTRALGNTKWYAISGLLYTGVYLTTSLSMVIALDYGVTALLLAVAIGHAASAVFLVASQKNFFLCKAEKLSKEEKSRVRKYSIALVPNDICWWIVGLSDRIFIFAFGGATANGIYSISQKFPTVISMMTSVFYNAWQDQSLSNYSHEAKDEYYTKVFSIYSRVLFLLCLCLIPATKYFVLLFMEASYHEAWMYVMPLYLGAVFSSLSAFLGVGYLGSKESGKSFTTTALGAAVNVLLNAVLMPVFPSHAVLIASITTAVSYLVVLVVRIIHTKAYFSIKYRPVELSLLFSANIACGFVLCFTNYTADLAITLICLATSAILLRDILRALWMKVLNNKGKKNE